MGAVDLIFKLRNDGYSISADGGYLDISPADDLSPELVRQLKLGKPEILTALDKEEKARTSRTPQKIVSGTKCENPAIQDEKLHELDLLIGYVASSEGFSDEDIIEAKHYANKDIENALTSFRALARDIRGAKAMELLQASPDSLRAIHIDHDSDPENIVITTALRHVAIFEMVVQRCKWDSFKMINILNGVVH